MRRPLLFSKPNPGSIHKRPPTAGNMTEHKDAGLGMPTGDLPAATQPIPYSAFTIWQKRWILFLAAFAAMFSPMSSFIFYPAITSMAESLHTTVGKIDLAITTYMVVSGVTPAILGGAADNMGRRPVYIVALAIYLAANVGLALQSNYTSLLILRMVQSAGSSGMLLFSPSRVEVRTD